MTNYETTASLLNSLRVNPVGSNRYEGVSSDLGWGRIFGGRLVAQALNAAQQSCTSDVSIHSLHCYFLRLGKINVPVDYQVEKLREGLSHQSFRVAAKQNGQDIFHLTASFHKPLNGLMHQDPMPNVTAPEDLSNDSVILKSYVDSLPTKLQTRLPHIVQCRIEENQPLELRPEHPIDFLNDPQNCPDRRMWMRFKDSEPINEKDNNLLLAYASDFSFLGVALQPHNLNTLNPRVSLASINHVIWFHQPTHMEKWNLFCAHSCQAGSGKALVRGSLFSKDGLLVASFAQEGILRWRGKK